MKPEFGFKGAINKALFGTLTSLQYARLIERYYRYLPTRARGHSVHFSQDPESNLLCAQHSNEKFYFVFPRRSSRYIWKEGVFQIANILWNKYVPSDFSFNSGGAVIDVGANVGEFSIAAAQRGMIVHAFEPDDGPFTALAKNLAPFKAAKANNAGLGERTELRSFFLSSRLADSSFIKPESFDAELQLKVITLDDYLAKTTLSKIELLKIEAEGFEPEVLMGAGKTLGLARAVSIDCSPEREGKDTFDACARILSDRGFTINRRGWILFATKNSS